MKRPTVVLLTLGVPLLVPDPARARGGGGHGGHCHGSGWGHTNAHGGGHSMRSSALGSTALSGFDQCSGTLQSGTVCQRGGFYGVTPPPQQGAPESDLGPWRIFLYLGRGVAGGVRWLTGLSLK